MTKVTMKTNFPLVSAVLGAILMAVLNPVQAATQQQIDTAWQKGLAWMIKNQQEDGSWAAGTGTEFIAITRAMKAFSNASVKNFNFAGGVAWVANATPNSVDSLSRTIIAKSALNMETGAANTANGDSTRLWGWRNYLGQWGAYSGYGTAQPDTGLAGMALAASKYQGYAVVDATNNICEMIWATPSATSGWSYVGSGWPYINAINTNYRPSHFSVSAVLPTASNVLALYTIKASMPLNTVQCGAATLALQGYIDGGLNWLRINKQKADGGFSDGTTSDVLLTAITLEALMAVRPTATETINATNYLINTQMQDGSWNRNAVATAYALSVLAKPTAMIDTDKDLIPDLVEVQLGSNPNVADSQNWLPENRSPNPVAPSFAVTAQQNTSVNYEMAVVGGNPPYTWKLTSGRLPSGLAMNAQTGVISGTPGIVGNSSMLFKIVDAAAKEAVYTGQISVVPVNRASNDFDGDGIPDTWEIANKFNKFDGNDATLDPDGDGLNNLGEYQNGTNMYVADSDGDGMNDGFEVTYGLAPLDPANATSPQCISPKTTYINGKGPGNDMDCDGLTNLDEANRGINPLKVDTDGDNVNDADEIAQGRNPKVNEPAIMSIIQNLLLN